MGSPEQIYQSRVEQLEREIKTLRVRFTYIYLLRFVSFIAAFAFVVLSISDFGFLYLALMLLCFVWFGMLVRLDARAWSRMKYLKAKLEINNNELRILSGDFAFRPQGDEYAAIDNHLTADFDIVGKGSMFSYLNRTVTKLGERLFAENLCRAELNRERILERQQAIEELGEKIEFVQDFQVYGSYFEESQGELDSVFGWASKPDKHLSRMRFFSAVAPLIVVVSLVLICLGIMPAQFIVVPCVMNLIFVAVNMSIINKGHAGLNRITKVIRKYTTLITLIEQQDFKSEYSNKVKQNLYHDNVSASSLSERLFKLLNMFDARANIIVLLVFNSLFAFDIQMYYRLARWKQSQGGYLKQWFETIAEFDSLMGLGVFGFNNAAHTVIPKLSDIEFGIEAKALAHPLMKHDSSVSNDISISKSPAVIIITGANMAGKSTFLRTMATNLILAMNGARVCAKEFTFAPANILSSIKIQDSLLKSESYFYAEISRLKDIVERVGQGERTLVVLDEILRGTNNKDKQQGSLGLLQKLIQKNAIVMVATHDLVIGELETQFPDIARNYCFEVELDDDKLVFDYKLKNGVSQKLNASFLLKKMGLIN
ncbi:MAG: hypothetical protein R3Y15_05605 [Rikenellaceae bacterium]